MGVCQKQSKTTVEHQGCLRQWVTVLTAGTNNRLTKRALKAEESEVHRGFRKLQHILGDHGGHMHTKAFVLDQKRSEKS